MTFRFPDLSKQEADALLIQPPRLVSRLRMCIWVVYVTLQLLDAHLGNGTSRRTATMMAPLLFTSGPVRYEAVLHLCETIPMGGLLPTCDSGHSWQLFSAASVEHQAASTMTGYPTQLFFPDRERISPCPILIMPNDMLGSDKYQFLNHWLDSIRARFKPVTIGCIGLYRLAVKVSGLRL